MGVWHGGSQRAGTWENVQLPGPAAVSGLSPCQGREDKHMAPGRLN